MLQSGPSRDVAERRIAEYALGVVEALALGEISPAQAERDLFNISNYQALKQATMHASLIELLEWGLELEDVNSKAPQGLEESLRAMRLLAEEVISGRCESNAGVLVRPDVSVEVAAKVGAGTVGSANLTSEAAVTSQENPLVEARRDLFEVCNSHFANTPYKVFARNGERIIGLPEENSKLRSKLADIDVLIVDPTSNAALVIELKTSGATPKSLAAAFGALLMSAVFQVERRQVRQVDSTHFVVITRRNGAHDMVLEQMSHSPALRNAGLDQRVHLVLYEKPSDAAELVRALVGQLFPNAQG